MGRTRTLPAAAMGIAAVSLSLGLGTVWPVRAYEPETHERISEAGVDRSNLDRILKDQYGVAHGTAFTINRNSVRRWVATGANQEDVPSTRALNHFHNPLQPWPQAGGPLGQSSIYWQQNPDQRPGDTWSWPVARRRFFEFLTLGSQGKREEALADTARALGQVMHMIQDSTSPAHTRDDPHLIFDGYEARIEELRQTNRARFDELLTAPPRFPSPSIFTPTGDTRAPVPIARLIDSDTYRETIESYTTGGVIGLAEYTNGGYVSDDTIFLDFALPRRASLGEGFCDPPPATPPCAPGSRLYFPKVADGDSVPHFVAEGTLLEPLRFRGQLLGGFILEDRVYEDYATHLLPRAVGYSAELLNYFFRGKLDVDLVPSAGDPALLELRVVNRSDEAMGPGTLSVHCDGETGNRTELSEKLILNDGEKVQPNAEFPRRVPFAPPDGTGPCMLVYRGQLGDEVPVPNADPTRDFPGAVIGKVLGQPLEVVFIGTVNGVDGFYLASEKGLFRIPVRDQQPFLTRLESISWGANDNILLISYVPGRSFEPNVFQIHRINRPKRSDAVPTKDVPDLKTGLKFVDTTVLGEFLYVPNFPIPGTVTTNVKINAKRFLMGTIIEDTVFPFGGGVNTRKQTDFKPLASDIQVFNLSRSTNINLDSQQMTNPSAAFSFPIHAFVDERDELIVLYKIHWQPTEMVRDEPVKVRSLGTLPQVPGQPVDPSRLCSEITSGTVGLGPESSAENPFPQFLSVSATDFCTLKVRPDVDLRVSLHDYMLINRSTGQILAQSFTDPTFSWEGEVHVISSFLTQLFHFKLNPNNPDQDFHHVNIGRSFLRSDRFPFGDRDVIAGPRSGMFGFTAAGRGLFGVTAGIEPVMFTQSQGTRRYLIVSEPPQTVFDYTFTTFTNRAKDDELELITNEELFRQFFALRNKGGLALLAHNQNDPVQYRVVRLPLPEQAGDPITAQVLTGPVTPSTGFDFDTTIEANETAILAKFQSLFVPGPPEKTVLISGPGDTVREVPGDASPEDLRIVVPNAFINDFEGKRKLQTPHFTNGTVTFTATATPEKDLLVAETFPNVQSLTVKPFDNKPQWHRVGR